MKIDVIFQGFPGRTERGYMGWSSVVFIETQDAKILFDTGGTGERSVLLPRLAAHHIQPEDIDYVVLSHFHYDHAMNFDLFPKARILLHEKEMEWVQSQPDDWACVGYLYPVLERTGRLSLLRDESEIVPGVQAILTPGHTPGCQSLVLRDDGMPVTVLAGDAVKNLAELSTGAVNMSHDDAASNHSIQRIRSLADIVIPGHDRVLKIEDNRITAVTSAHETITVPAGVCQSEPRKLELVVEQTWLPKI
jgi:glyoxylase-like metal-dependent hydrolase (beta-lactamase superfamily II)